LVSSKSGFRDIADVSVEGRKIFSREVKAVKVVCKSTKALGENAKRLTKETEVEQVLEEDIRYSCLYLLETGAVPCQWCQLQVREIGVSEASVTNTYAATSSPTATPVDGIPELRIIAFSWMAFGERSSPNAARDPISVIAVARNDGQERTFVRSDLSDRDVIVRFVEFLKKFDPHIVAGFESNRVGWPYLMERAKLSGASLDVGRIGSSPHMSVYGHVSITGRVSMDVFNYADELPEVKVKTIENVAEFLGITVSTILPDELELSTAWSKSDSRHHLEDCTLNRARATLEMAKRFLEFGIELSSLTCMPLDQVAAAAVGHRVDLYLMKEAHTQGHLIPHRIERPYMRYQGAIVLEPQKGLHENVVALDFTSMYPNLMILYNLSPDTFVPIHEEIDSDQCWLIEGPGHRFRKSPPGLYKRALTNLIAFRNSVKDKLKSASLSDSERRILAERERAVKVITNGCYGYAGWPGARWYVREVAESAATLGRLSISRVIQRCRDVDLTVIYADTDAVFVNHDKDKVDALLRWVSENLHMDIRPDKMYQRVLFTEAKKKYAGLLVDGTIDIVGMEVVRGDWSEIARDIQERVIEMILTEGSLDKAKEYALTAISQVRRGKIELQDFIIWKSLTKPIEEYNVRAPHVEVARKYLTLGRELVPGDKIGYVVTTKGTKLHEKAQPYFAVAPDQVDREYYISNQVVPVVARVLGVFNIGEDQLVSGEQHSLT